MNRIRKFALAGVVVVPMVAGAFVVQERTTRDGGRLFGQVLDLVESRFVDSVDAAMLYEKAARGLVSQLQDPYSELFSPRQLTQFNTTTAGRYGGLGMQIEEQPGKGVVVSKVFPHTPAEAAGAREGDIFVAIDTLSMRGWSSARVADSLRGVPGSKVSVTFARPSVPEPIKSTFTRAVIHVPAVPFAIMFDKVGYIPLQGFNETATQEISAAVRRLAMQEGAKGLIIDLRGNGGGFLDQSLAISVSGSLLLDDLDLVIQAALDGAGLAWVAEDRVTQYLASGALVRVLEDWCPPFPGFFLYYPSRKQQPAALAAVIEAFRL